jgi:hypothetical protein
MALRAVEWTATGATAPYSSYDSTKTVLGDLIKQYTGSANEDKYAGPIRTGRDNALTTYYAIARPNETSTAVPGVFPHVVRWANKTGFYSTGTVAVSGTAVTGTGTSFLAGGVPVGARIGFGSTDSAAITTWYTITAVASATSITLQSSAGTIAGGTSYVIDKTLQIDWVFLADNAAAAATRRMTLFTLDRQTSVFTWRGFITQTYPAATNHTIRGMRAVYQAYSTGTVAVAGAAVTGVGTAWSTNRIFIGSRIGFGSTDPNQISTWYYINAVTTDLAITIQNNVTASGTGGVASNLTISAGTAYVIEDLKILNANTNATTTNGGLFMTGGISFDDFVSAGTTIAAAATTDKAKANYWLADASVVTDTIADGCALDDFVDMSNQFCYVIDSTATPKVYKYNFRKALTLTGGKDTTTLVLATGVQTLTGTVSQNNNGRVGTLGHGPGSGVKCLYFATTTRIYRAPVSGITNGSTTWAVDSMQEVPTGSTTTFNVSSVMTAVEIVDSIDRLLITGTGAGTIPANNRAWVTQYNTISTPFDYPLFVDTRQIDQSTSDNNSCPHPSPQGAVLNVWSEGGLTYVTRTGTTSLINTLYAFPIGADWDFAGSLNQRLITPALTTTNAVKLRRVLVTDEDYMGGGGLRLPVESWRIYYRTTGISDNSGSWTLIDRSGDMSTATPGTQVQFMFEFRTIGTFCLPARIFSAACLYEDNTTDSHYQPSVAFSSAASKQFAWRFSTAFGSTVPTLRIRLYDAVTGGLLVDDTSASPTGTWEKTTNGGSSWAAYDTSDKGNETTYIRYTPASLGDNVKVRALLTQN